MNQHNKNVKKYHLFLLIATTLMHYALYLVIPVLPILLKQSASLSAGKISIIIGSQALALQIGSMINAFLSDRIGKKYSLFSGTIILTSAIFLYPIVHHFSVFLLLAIGFGIGNGMNAPTLKAAIAEATPKGNNEQTMAFSFRSIFANLGLAMAGITIFIIHRQRPTLIFYLAAGITTLLFILFIFFFPNQKSNRKKLSIKDYKCILKNKPFLLLSILIVLVTFGYAQLPFLLPLRINAVLNKNQYIGLIWFIMSIQVMIVQLPIGKFILQRIHPFYSYSLALLFFSTGILAIGFSSSLIPLILSAILYTFGQVFMSPITDRLTGQLCEEHLRGAYFGFVNLLIGLGGAIGTYTSGYLISTFKITNILPWIIISTLLLTFSIIILIIKRHQYFKNLDTEK